MEEIWKAVKGFEGLYEVSNFGRVRSVDRYVDNHGTKDFRTGAIKAQRTNTTGYYILDLYKDGRQYTKFVHRIEAEAFIENIENKETVNHINGNHQDNRLENLEWATPREQNLHFYKHKLKSEENIKKAVNAMNDANTKKVKCVERGIIYASIAEACDNLNKKRNCGSTISAVCKGKRKTAYGFTWEYC